MAFKFLHLSYVYRRIKKIGQGSYVIAEYGALQKQDYAYQKAFADVESAIIQKCNADWSPRTFNPSNTFGSDSVGKNYGRTTILPPLFNDMTATQMVTYRQLFTTAGNQLIMTGASAGHVMPENTKVALMGFAFPNKYNHITEIKMNISDRKFLRINLEDIYNYDSPAVVFEEGYVLDESEAFELYAYYDGTIPTHHDAFVGSYQRIVPLGALYFKYYDTVGGNPGAAIIIT